MKVIPEYMIAQNRPYGATDVYTNLHQEFGKTLVIKCLESAVENGLLRGKIISKQKIYYANQDKLTTFDDAELAEMDKEINQKSEYLNNINLEFKSLTCEVKSLEAQPTTPQLTQAIERLEIELSEMEKRRNELKANQYSVSAEERKKVEKDLENYEKLMRQRKRCAEDMIAAISDNYPKKKNVLLDEIGVELD